MQDSAAWGLTSDAELIAAVRTGDADAFAALRERHLPVAEAVARAGGATDDEAERAVAAAFDRIGLELRAGDGPAVAFRSHLCSVVRAESTPGSTHAEGDVAGVHPAVAAYGSLHPRWREVLWYTDVEGLRPAAVAPVLGLSPEATAALARIARQGLRQACLRQHAAATVAEDCLPVVGTLPAHLGGTLAQEKAEAVGRHLEGCASCRGVVDALEDVPGLLRTSIAPAILGAAAASAIHGVGFGGPDTAGTPVDGALVGTGAAAVVLTSTATPSAEGTDAVEAAPPVAVVPQPSMPGDDVEEPHREHVLVAAATAAPVASTEDDPRAGWPLVAASSGFAAVLLGLLVMGAVDGFGASSTDGTTTGDLQASDVAAAPGSLDAPSAGLALPLLGAANVPPALGSGPRALPFAERSASTEATTGDDSAGSATAPAAGAPEQGSPTQRPGTSAGAGGSGTPGWLAPGSLDFPGSPAPGTSSAAPRPAVRPAPAAPGTSAPARPGTSSPARPPATAPRPVTPPASAPRPVSPPAAGPRPVSPPAAAPRPITPPAAAPRPVSPPAAAPPPVTAPVVVPRPAAPAPAPRPPAVTPPSDDDDDRGNGRGDDDDRGNGNGNGRGGDDDDRGNGRGDDDDRGNGNGNGNGNGRGGDDDRGKGNGRDDDDDDDDDDRGNGRGGRD